MNYNKTILLMLLSITCLFVSKGHAQNETITVSSRGLGVDPESAKKDAFINAMQQAIGSYIDSETIIENDEIIKDKILSVSDGFVEKYDVVSEAKERGDGLYEIAIKATVRKGKMLARLKEVRVTGVEVAGKDVAAELSTKIENAKQGAQLLEKHLDGLLEKLLVARLVDQNGKPSKQVRPITKILQDKRIECQWNIEVYFNTRSFYEKASPQLKKVFTAVATDEIGSSICVGKKHVYKYTTAVTNYPVFQVEEWQGATPRLKRDDDRFVISLSIGRDSYGQNERFQSFALDKNLYGAVVNKAFESAAETKLNFYALDSSGGVILQQMVDLTSTHLKKRNQTSASNYRPNMFPMEYTLGSRLISPTFASSRYETASRSDNDDGYSDTLFIPFKVVIAQEDIENITDVRFRFGK